MRRRFSCVITATTPGTASAAVAWIAAMRPLAIVAETTQPCSRSGVLNSAAYVRRPVTFSRPSTRLRGLPICELLHSDAPYAMRLSVCGLRRAGGGLRQRPHDRPARQLDLEVVVAKPWRACSMRRAAAETRLAGSLPFQQRLGLRDAPRLVRDAAERDPGAAIASPSIAMPTATDTSAKA